MNSYALFGYGLSSEFPFPELTQRPEVDLRWWVRPLPPDIEQQPVTLLREVVALPCTLRLYRTQTGYRLQHICTGDYFVSADGTQIEYRLAPSAHPDAVRSDILGRVMALALHVGGLLCLHGSGVGLRHGAVGFIAPKGYGKSTLASALVREGGRLVSDDLLVIEPGRPVMVLPGVPRLRLRDDSFESTLLEVCRAERGADGKQVVRNFPDRSLVDAPLPLLALYTLDPMLPTRDAPPATRERLTPSAGARAMVPMGKNASILDSMETFGVLERAMTVASQVPVYRLSVSRDLNRVSAVARQIVEWHDADPSLPTGVTGPPRSA